MTQNQRVLRYLQDHGFITSVQAVYEYGIMSLSRRICDLKAQGFRIGHKTEQSKNRYGETVYFNKYYLMEDTNNGIS